MFGSGVGQAQFYIRVDAYQGVHARSALTCGMDIALPSSRRGAVSLWRDTLMPKEHGSWSLAFEPIALSLLVAPSMPGVFLAMALGAGFFARRPLRIAQRETRWERRLGAMWALLGCAGIALPSLLAAVAQGGAEWLVWLAPMAVAAVVFAYFDLRGSGREEAAEVVGAAAFALAPAAFAALAGWQPLESIALAAVMLARAVPSVLCVRAFLRAAKTGVRRDAPALIAACVALAVTVLLFERGVAPFFAVVAVSIFCFRSFALLVFLRPSWRARSIGMLEAILGVAFVIGLAVTAHL